MKLLRTVPYALLMHWSSLQHQELCSVAWRAGGRAGIRFPSATPAVPCGQNVANQQVANEPLALQEHVDVPYGTPGERMARCGKEW